jgi:hypothetical protein
MFLSLFLFRCDRKTKAKHPTGRGVDQTFLQRTVRISIVHYQASVLAYVESAIRILFKVQTEYHSYLAYRNLGSLTTEVSVCPSHHSLRMTHSCLRRDLISNGRDLSRELKKPSHSNEDRWTLPAFSLFSIAFHLASVPRKPCITFVA